MKQKGFTVIELMIVVSILSILSAIALPLYSNYMQKTANNACLGEAKYYMTVAIAGIASAEKIPVDYVPSACEKASTMSIPYLKAGQTFDSISEVVFEPQLRGMLNQKQLVKCKTSGVNCSLFN